MKPQTINQIRNSVHVIAGFCAAYWAFSFLNNNDFWLWQRLIMYFLLGTALGGAIGFLWEAFMDIAFKEPSDMTDVIRTAIGGFLGGALCFWKQDIALIKYLLVACIIMALADVYRAYRNNLNK